MRRPIGTVTAMLLLAAPAAGQKYQVDDRNRLGWTLARVKPGMRGYFETGNWRYGCASAVAAKCRSKSYVVGGDVVLVGETRGAMVRAAFTNGTRMTIDWLPRAVLIAIPAAPVPLAGWRGTWRRDDEAKIDIRLDRQHGALTLSGEAFYGSRAPDRVASGAVHLGQISGTAVPVRGTLKISDADQICQAELRRTGPYLVVVDNQQCGGVNVSFSGIYRKR